MHKRVLPRRTLRPRRSFKPRISEAGSTLRFVSQISRILFLPQSRSQLRVLGDRSSQSELFQNESPSSTRAYRPSIKLTASHWAISPKFMLCPPVSILTLSLQHTKLLTRRLSHREKTYIFSHREHRFHRDFEIQILTSISKNTKLLTNRGGYYYAGHYLV